MCEGMQAREHGSTVYSLLFVLVVALKKKLTLDAGVIWSEDKENKFITLTKWCLLTNLSIFECYIFYCEAFILCDMQALNWIITNWSQL